MKNILIIGGGGFIGKNLINFLSKDTQSNKFNQFIITSNSKVSDNFKTFNFRLNQIEEIKNLISQNKISVIIHLASGLIPSSSVHDFRNEIEDVVSPSSMIFSYASKKGIKVIFLSSGGTVYKNSVNRHKETDNLDPISFYGESKVILEDSLRSLKETDNLKYVILRPSNVYGASFKLNPSQGLIPNTINNILEKKPIEIWGDGSSKRDYLFVDDISEAISKLIGNEDINGEFNIASSSVHSVNDVIKLVEEKLNMKTKIIFKGKRSTDVSCSILDISKIKESINFHPHDLNFGLDQIIKNISF
jgi:UDP-glucose 4-epimerase